MTRVAQLCARSEDHASRAGDAPKHGGGRAWARVSPPSASRHMGPLRVVVANRATRGAEVTVGICLVRPVAIPLVRHAARLGETLLLAHGRETRRLRLVIATKVRRERARLEEAHFGAPTVFASGCAG